ncbi:MAG TPA: DUF488 domain-containing protein [Solirubrobacterales bacterium]|nr:DUF488 domain-containing protein [Solirubrobacterales bacterium]
MVPPHPPAGARRSAARGRTSRSPGPGLPRTAAALLSRTLATIGVYGFDGASFAAALRRAGITLLLDVRQRRGVRGSEYAWANARRLEAALEEKGIAYSHLPELAPTTAMRRLQYREDERRGEGKRSRTELAPEYVLRYTEEVLDQVDLEPIVNWMGSKRPVLLCVERDPEACHRSLVAARLKSEFGFDVEHLKPE